MEPWTEEISKETLHKPRILCLHGGGVSAEIFTLQMRGILRYLKPHFRLVFADGPYDAGMHPDLVPVYSDFKGCKRWSGWLPEHGTVDDEVATAAIEKSLVTAMQADKGTGEFIGLLGFSQGAKTVASILMDTQLRKEAMGRNGTNGWSNDQEIPVGFAGGKWRFAIILAGRPPLFSLSGVTRHNSDFIGPGQLEKNWQFPPNGLDNRLRMPTLHVHGLRDPGLELHRRLYRDYCEDGTKQLIEWDEAHRLPFRQADVKVISDGIISTVKAAGIAL